MPRSEAGNDAQQNAESFANFQPCNLYKSVANKNVCTRSCDGAIARRRFSELCGANGAFSLMKYIVLLHYSTIAIRLPFSEISPFPFYKFTERTGHRKKRSNRIGPNIG